MEKISKKWSGSWRDWAVLTVVLAAATTIVQLIVHAAMLVYRASL